MPTKFGMNAPNKSAGDCPVYVKPYHVPIKPNISGPKPGMNTSAYPVKDNTFTGSKPFTRTGKG